jgi:hypothetical protein
MLLAGCALADVFGPRLAVAQAPAASALSFAAFDDLLGRYVLAHSDGINRVDYGRWKANAPDVRALKDFISAVAGRQLSKLPRNEAFAAWANLYNAITLNVVLDRYPVASIREIKSDGLFDPKAYLGPWRTKRVMVEGKQLSLDDIEHEIMRPTFKDSRVHYAVNCASLGCPNLPARAWNATSLDADLDRAAREFVNHKRGVEVLSGGKLKVSSIYKWFAEDFGGDNAAVVAHLRKYAAPALAARLSKSAEIVEDEYSWALNDAKARSPR